MAGVAKFVSTRCESSAGYASAATKTHCDRGGGAGDGDGDGEGEGDCWRKMLVVII